MAKKILLRISLTTSLTSSNYYQHSLYFLKILYNFVTEFVMITELWVPILWCWYCWSTIHSAEVFLFFCIGIFLRYAINVEDFWFKESLGYLLFLFFLYYIGFTEDSLTLLLLLFSCLNQLILHYCKSDWLCRLKRFRNCQNDKQCCKEVYKAFLCTPTGSAQGRFD